jgi:hypothetical protein
LYIRSVLSIRNITVIINRLNVGCRVHVGFSGWWAGDFSQDCLCGSPSLLYCWGGGEEWALSITLLSSFKVWNARSVHDHNLPLHFVIMKERLVCTKRNLCTLDEQFGLVTHLTFRKHRLKCFHLHKLNYFLFNFRCAHSGTFLLTSWDILYAKYMTMCVM